MKVKVSAKLEIRCGGRRGRGRLGRCVRGCILRCLNFPAEFVGGMGAASGSCRVGRAGTGGCSADRLDHSSPQPARAVAPGSVLSAASRSGPG